MPPETNLCVPRCLVKIVLGHGFDTGASLLVLVSVMMFFVQTDYTARNWLQDPPQIFQWIEVALAIIFSLEITLRILCHGPISFFRGQQRKWNMFDLVLVILQVADVLASSIDLHKPKMMSLAPFVRALRLARIARLGRLLRKVPELRSLLVSLLASFAPLMWVFILILIVTSGFAIILTQIATDLKTSVSDTEQTFQDSEQHQVQEFFGNIFVSIVTLYMAISGGKDWGEVSYPMQTYCSNWCVLIITAYTFFVIFAMTNVVTSHFVEEAVEAASRDRREHVTENLREMFLSELRGDGYITKEDFMAKVDEPHMQFFLYNLYHRSVSKEELEEQCFFEVLDLNQSGMIEAEELVHGCARLSGSATALSLAVLKRDCDYHFNRFLKFQEGSERRAEEIKIMLRELHCHLVQKKVDPI